MEGFVYFLYSQKNDKFYIGSTIHIDVRLAQHNSGFVQATKYLRPWSLVFTQKYPTIKQARQIEYKLKKLKNRNIIERILQEKEIKTGR